MNHDLTLNHLLLVDPLHHISSLHIHLDRISTTRDLMAQSLDLAERGLETIPLRLVLLAALRDAERVDELAVIGPEVEFLRGGSAGEEIEGAAYEGLLALAQGDAGGGVDVGVFDAVLGCF